MSNLRFDWRWVALIAIVAIIANGTHLPWPILAAAFAGGGGYLLYLGWRMWSSGSISPRRVTYWRGQRIETPTRHRMSMPPLRAMVPALPYLLIGLALVVAGVSILLRQLGI